MWLESDCVELHPLFPYAAPWSCSQRVSWVCSSAPFRKGEVAVSENKQDLSTLSQVDDTDAMDPEEPAELEKK
ncbi:hypothetical protein L798_15353 [Zootermopsis nevadensis]|uniref:Uncharacterized protein n=1 Tax=Zootermopsis nevadensis TaxID=136037 RepID=A0A067R0E0_ZOONE|nr:hypothetical protein L798_15353 [Zootermopsis nevadensis]